MKRITDFLNECNRCDLGQPNYNGCSDDSNYTAYIDRLYQGAVSALVEHSGDAVMAIIGARIAEVRERMRYVDFPSDETINRMKEECKTSTNDSPHRDCAYLMMAKRCRDEQIFRFNEFAKYLSVDGCGSPAQEPVIPEPMTDAPTRESINDKDYIKGVRRLAEYLDCGNNKAGAIIKNGVLKRVGVQFKFGNANYFHKQKLQEALSANPDLFKDVIGTKTCTHSCIR